MGITQNISFDTLCLKAAKPLLLPQNPAGCQGL